MNKWMPKVQEGKKGTTLAKVEPVLLRAVCSVISDSLQPHGCSPPGSSARGILPARIQEWLPCPPLRDLATRGSELCVLPLLHWKVDSLPLVPPEKLPVFLKKTYLLGVGVGIELSGEVIEQPLKSITGASLGVQWVWLCASNARDAGWIPGWVTKMPHGQKNFFWKV